MTRWVLRPVGPQGAADGLGYIQVPQVLAPGLMLNRSVSPGDPTHRHQSRYPKSRLFEYLPDLPSDVEILLSRHTLSPRTPRRPNCKGGILIGRQLLHKPRDALGSAACGAAGRCRWSRIHSSATSIGARTCAESIGFSR